MSRDTNGGMVVLRAKHVAVAAACGLLAAVAISPALRGVARSALGLPPPPLLRVARIGFPSAPVAVAWAPDGSKLAVATWFGSTINIVRTDGRRLRTIAAGGNGPVLSGAIAFSADSRRIVFAPDRASGDNAVLAVWDVATGLKTGVVPLPEGLEGEGRRDHLFARTGPGDGLVIASARGSLKHSLAGPLIYCPEPGVRCQNLGPLSSTARSLAVSGGKAAIGLFEGDLEVLALDGRTSALKVHAFPGAGLAGIAVSAITLSPQGDTLFAGKQVVSISGPTDVSERWADSLPAGVFIRTSDGQVVSRLTTPVAPVRAAAWDPKGRYVALTDNGGGLFLVNARSHQVVTRAQLNTADPYTLAVSADGERIAVADGNGVSVFALTPSAKF